MPVGKIPAPAAVVVAVVIALAVAATVGLAGCGGEDDSLVVGFDGISGISYGATPEQAASHWRMPLRFVQEGSGSSSVAQAPLCGHGVRGDAVFVGTDVGPVNFRSAWFLAGAKTDRGVGIGSTLTQLRKAYGSTLRKLPTLDEAMKVIDPLGHGKAEYVVVHGRPSPDHPRTVIDFGLSSGRVVLLGWSRLQAPGVWTPYGVSC